MAVPNIFGSATSAIPLSQLDTNFATPVTIGNTAVQLGNTVTSFGNVTLTNVTISSGNVTVSAGSNTAPSITTVGDTNTGIFFPAADTIAFSEGGAEAARFDSAGNLGIGTTSPVGYTNYKGLTVADTTGGFVHLRNTANTQQFELGINGGTSAAYLATYTSTPIQFLINSTERARIDSSGNLLVGTTTVYSNAKVTINSATAANPALSAFKTVTGDTSNPAIVVSKFDNDSTTSQVIMQFLYNNGSSGCGQINAAGAGNAAFGAYSDIRLKQNITDLPSQLANIMALRPVEFDWKNGDGHQIGFIAQEVQAVYPDLVGIGADEMFTLTDMNKNDARLIKAIQEQQALIQSLTARITALEAK